MPRKIRQLLKDYRKGGFKILLDAGKGSHRKVVHAVHSTITVILSGQDGDDAKHYQEKDLCAALQKVKDADKK